MIKKYRKSAVLTGKKITQKHEGTFNVMEPLKELDVIYRLSKDPTITKVASFLLATSAEKNGYKKGMGLEAYEHAKKLLSTENFQEEMSSKKLEVLFDISEDRDTKFFKKNEIIYHVGQTPKGLCFIKKGKVKSFITNDDGKEYIIDFYKKGDILGYIPLLTNTLYPKSAMALEETEISFIPKNEFLLLIFSNKEISGKFIDLLAREIREREMLMAKLAYDSIRIRVADTLLRLGNKFKDDTGNYKEIVLSRDNLAKKVGTTKETLVRTLTQFRNEKLIEINSSGIKIIDFDKLFELKN